MVLMSDLFAIRVSGLDNSPQNKAEREAAKDFMNEYVRKNGNPIPTEIPKWAEGCIPNVGCKRLYS